MRFDGISRISRGTISVNAGTTVLVSGTTAGTVSAAVQGLSETMTPTTGLLTTYDGSTIPSSSEWSDAPFNQLWANAGNAGTAAPDVISVITYPKVVSGNSSLGFAGLQYSDVSEALAVLAGNEEPIDWRIHSQVYSTSLQVAATLSERGIPAPSVFSNEADSVVFNWSKDGAALYLTVTKDQLWLMYADQEQIHYRGELNSNAGPLGFAEFVNGLENEPRLLPGKVTA